MEENIRYAYLFRLMHDNFHILTYQLPIKMGSIYPVFFTYGKRPAKNADNLEKKQWEKRENTRLELKRKLYDDVGVKSICTLKGKLPQLMIRSTQVCPLGYISCAMCCSNIHNSRGFLYKIHYVVHVWAGHIPIKGTYVSNR